jgi:hypothetical protein
MKLGRQQITLRNPRFRSDVGRITPGSISISAFGHGSDECVIDLLGRDGEVVIPESPARFLEKTRVRVPGGALVTPLDGERYLEGLVFPFRGSRFSAAPVDESEEGEEKEGSGESPERGPEIIFLDPNDPEGAYKQLMEQYRKHRGDMDG